MSIEIEYVGIGRNFEIFLEATWYSKRNDCTKMDGVRMLKT